MFNIMTYMDLEDSSKRNATSWGSMPERNVAPFQGECQGLAVPVLCITGASLYTQLHVYPATGKAALYR